MRRLTNARDIVDALGGVHAVCDLTGAHPKAVYHWIGAANMFPARFFDMMKKALKRRGCTAPASLWNQMPANKVA